MKRHEHLHLLPTVDETKEGFRAWWAGGAVSRTMIKRRGIRAGYESYHLPVSDGPYQVHAEPEFRPDTVWYSETIEGCESRPPLQIDPENKWWKLHQEVIRQQIEFSGGEYLVGIPDIIENIDTLSALRGPQALCFDLFDRPEAVKQ